MIKPQSRAGMAPARTVNPVSGELTTTVPRYTEAVISPTVNRTTIALWRIKVSRCSQNIPADRAIGGYSIGAGCSRERCKEWISCCETRSSLQPGSALYLKSKTDEDKKENIQLASVAVCRANVGLV